MNQQIEFQELNILYINKLHFMMCNILTKRGKILLHKFLLIKYIRFHKKDIYNRFNDKKNIMEQYFSKHNIHFIINNLHLSMKYKHKYLNYMQHNWLQQDNFYHKCLKHSKATHNYKKYKRMFRHCKFNNLLHYRHSFYGNRHKYSDLCLHQ